MTEFCGNNQLLLFVFAGWHSENFKPVLVYDNTVESLRNLSPLFIRIDLRRLSDCQRH